MSNQKRVEEFSRLRKIADKYRSMFEIFDEQVQEIARREGVEVVSNYQLLIASGLENLSDILSIGQAVAAGKLSASPGVSDIVSLAALETWKKQSEKQYKEAVLKLHNANNKNG